MGQALVQFLCNDVARVLIATVLLVGTIGLLWAGKPVPDVLWALDGAAVSFYFAVTIAKNSR